MTEATIILEGGASRGAFTAGVLDYLMEQKQYLSHVIGVSMGSCNGVDYVSRQIGRTRDCIIHKEKENKYINGFPKAIKEKSLLDMDKVFIDYPNEIYPFDYDTYFASEMECEIVVTNCETGKAEYLQESQDGERLMQICRASSSMPVVSPMVTVDGVPYLDGGIADSIPLRRALKEGKKKIVVVLTRSQGYRKKPTTKGAAKIYRRFYRDYPNLARAAVRRNYVYNKTAELVERLEEEGRIFVLRPEIPPVSRLERNYDALMDFYEHGYEVMRREYSGLMEYLDRESH